MGIGIDCRRNRPIPDLPGVPGALIEVLRYGMANDPRVRPNAEQLRELLEGVQLPPNGRAAPPTLYRSSTFVPPQYTQPRPVPPVSPTLDPGDETPTQHTDSPKQARGKRKWLFGGFGVFLVLTTALGSALLAGRP